jgi:hypothetical protein
MAYTFEELETWWTGKSFPVADVTLVRTQEDSRTGYSHGFSNGYDPTKKLFVGQFAEQFNDRTRKLVYGPPSPSAGNYLQNFDLNSGIDLANFEFVRLAPGKYELRLKFLRWGASATIAMTKPTQAKIYVGWGATIGNTTTQALYALSLNAAYETPG